jgi:hypothetical protein
MNRVHLSAKDLEEAADVPVFGTAHRCSEADSVGSDVLASGAVRFPERAACARRLSPKWDEPVALKRATLCG